MKIIILSFLLLVGCSNNHDKIQKQIDALSYRTMMLETEVELLKVK